MRVVIRRALLVSITVMLMVACGSSDETATPEQEQAVATETPVPTATPEPRPTETNPPPTDTVEPSATAEPSATPLPPSPTRPPLQVTVEPTATPDPDEDVMVRDLNLGARGRYTNLVFGYRFEYPLEWYTGFGNRPLLVSMSNLDPGSHNRDSQRRDGCLIEVTASTNVAGFSLAEMAARMPQSFQNAEDVEFAGETGTRIRRTNTESAVTSQQIFITHEDRLFLITLDYAEAAAETCQAGWETVESSWEWFEPDFSVYRSSEYGYAIEYPRTWYPFNRDETRTFVSSINPEGMTSRLEIAQQGMLVETLVDDNTANLTLHEWVAQNVGDTERSNDVVLDTQTGVRTLNDRPDDGIQEMTGYFQGPLGNIYIIRMWYPLEQEWEYRSIGNFIIYSFSI